MSVAARRPYSRLSGRFVHFRGAGGRPRGQESGELRGEHCGDRACRRVCFPAVADFCGKHADAPADAVHGSGDVTVGYVKPSIEALREATEKVARFLLGKAGAKA